MILARLTSVLRWVARKMADLSRSEWNEIIDAVVEAEDAFSINSLKKNFVTNIIATLKPAVTVFLTNLLLELAVGYAKEKGLVDA